MLVGDRVGQDPVLIIFAIMAGGELFGFFGVLVDSRCGNWGCAVKTPLRKFRT